MEVHGLDVMLIIILVVELRVSHMFFMIFFIMYSALNMVVGSRLTETMRIVSLMAGHIPMLVVKRVTIDMMFGLEIEGVVVSDMGWLMMNWLVTGRIDGLVIVGCSPVFRRFIS